MNTKSNEIIKQLNRLTNDRNLTLYTRNKLREAIDHVRALQLKLSESTREAKSVTLERLETLISRQRDLIKSLEHENRRLRLQARASTKRVKNLKKTNAVIDKEPA
jgi:FtsZ-binding cell division protein ZapB